MNQEEVLTQKVRVLAPWEKVFDRFATPFERFTQRETASGILLLMFTAIALVLANSPLAELYYQVLHTPLRLSFGVVSIEKTFQHWVNEGLMTLFFFVVGLEIKHELLVGDLSRPRQAILPIIAAAGGMAAPAAVFLLLVSETDAVRGWGIPMATDIAFAVAALALLGSRIPRSVMAFLLALAIVDDLGALVVIALFYSSELDLKALLAAGGLFLVMLALNRFGLRRPWPYFVLATMLWAAMLESGVHATLAGVVTAFAIPARPKYDPTRFADLFATLLQRYRASFKRGEPVLRNERARSTLQTMEDAVLGVVPPLQRLEYKLHTPTALLVMPLFALCNAGIEVGADSIALALAQPLTWGVIAGLLAGKVFGITVATWLGLQTGLLHLPNRMRFVHVVGIGLLAGIGFTMSLFITELAFGGYETYTAAAKTGILISSLLAGGLGLLWLRLSSE